MVDCTSELDLREHEMEEAKTADLESGTAYGACSESSAQAE